MLSLNNLTLSIYDKIIFKDLNITFLPSSIIHIIGSNGSGKTSLLRMIAGLQKQSNGHIELYKENINNLPKPYCLYIGHNQGLKLELTILENLQLWSKFYNSEETLEASINYFNLQDLLYKKCYELSAGNQKRVALSKLLSCQSGLWLLDEFESNLDEKNKALIQNLIISKANHGGIILMTSHNNKEIKSAITLNMEDYHE